MKITVCRFVDSGDASASLVIVDDKFQCFGLEDEYRTKKVYGETRIPSGRYKVGVRKVGGFHAKYSRRFQDFHEGMLEILGVPNFEHILIHVGNTDEDTAGCLLVGRGCNTAGEITVSHSVAAYTALYKKVIESAKAGDLYIEFVDLER